MPMNWNPSDRQLRQFGLTAWIALPILAAFWTAPAAARIAGAAGVGTLGAVLGWFYPRSLKWPFVALSLLSLPIGFVLHELCLALVYFGVLVPLGLVFRCLGRDALGMRRDARATSYWQVKKEPSGVASYFRRW
jgi:hypothetical protein